MTESEMRKELKETEMKRGCVKVRPDEETLERMTY